MIYTMGHSLWVPDQFLAALSLLPGQKVVVDVRSHPSSKWPWFNKGVFPNWVRGAGHNFLWMRDLGGWGYHHMDRIDEMAKHGVDLTVYANGKFPKHHIAKGSQATLLPQWTNVGLYDYSWYTAQREFLTALKLLINCRKRYPDTSFVLVCAEAQWWRCHRSMISDVLWFCGINSTHITPRFRRDGTCTIKVEHHGNVIGNRIERYDPQIINAWSVLV